LIQGLINLEEYKETRDCLLVKAGWKAVLLLTYTGDSLGAGYCLAASDLTHISSERTIATRRQEVAGVAAGQVNGPCLGCDSVATCLKIPRFGEDSSLVEHPCLLIKQVPAFCIISVES